MIMDNEKDAQLGYKLPTHGEMKMIRKTLGLTQEKVAESLDVSQRSISNMENGNGNTSLQTVRQALSYYAMVIENREDS
jgi:predicted transcriptional regulator